VLDADRLILAKDQAFSCAFSAIPNQWLCDEEGALIAAVPGSFNQLRTDSADTFVMFRVGAFERNLVPLACENSTRRANSLKAASSSEDSDRIVSLRRSFDSAVPKVSWHLADRHMAKSSR